MKLNRKKYLASHLNRMDFFERKFIPVMAKAIKSQISAFIADMKSHGIEEAKRRMDNVGVNVPVQLAVSKIYKTVGVFMANDTYRKIIDQVKQQKGFGFNQEWIDALVQYFKEYLLNKAVFPITATTREQIRQVLILGEKNGWGVDEIARKLAETDITVMRARLIVRTETAKAAFAGRELAKSKSDYQLTSEWIAAHGLRTRHSHRIVDGLTIQMGGKFSVPVYKRVGKADIQIGTDMMIGPGDPQASKGNVCNCRCTTVERVVFDEQSNPVMKRQNVLA